MTDAQQHLDDLARDIASPVPAGLLDTARTARRRRVRGRVAAGGAVTAVAVVALAVTLPGTGGPPLPQPGPSVATPVGDPVAPDGTRWVGQAGSMVAVPIEWSRTRTNCVGAVQEEGPGFYYLEVDSNYCYDPVDEAPSVGLFDGRGSEVYSDTGLVCDPACGQTVSRGRTVLRIKGVASAAAVSAIVDTLQPLPASWVVDAASGLAGPRDAEVPDSRPVTDVAEVAGEWLVTEVMGGPVPADAERGLTVTTGGSRGLGLSFYDGVNTTSRSARLGQDGTLRGERTLTMTSMGCVAPDGGTCAVPSGFGVADATQLRLTPDGHLVLVGAIGEALAVYERA